MSGKEAVVTTDASPHGARVFAPSDHHDHDDSESSA